MKVHPLSIVQPALPALPPIRPQKPKDRIPKALREQVWLKTAGPHFEIKCPTPWCRNRINAFDYHVGHNVPEVAGGTLHIENLIAICARCNLSMSSTFTIDQWNHLVLCKKVGTSGEVVLLPWWKRIFFCYGG